LAPPAKTELRRRGFSGWIDDDFEIRIRISSLV
jgi:hypothetical protein